MRVCARVCVCVQVDSAWTAGDYEGARSNSRAALGLSIASIIIGLFIIVGNSVYIGIHYSQLQNDPDY